MPQTSYLTKSWAGYFGPDSSGGWFTSATSYGNPSGGINNTLSLIERDNNNLGLVKAYDDGTPGNNWPGIVFTPELGARYQITAKFNTFETSNQDVVFRMTDGTTVLDACAGAGLSTATNLITTINMQGIYKAPSASPQTIRIEMGMTAAVNGGIEPGFFAGMAVMEWSIIKL